MGKKDLSDHFSDMVYPGWTERLLSLYHVRVDANVNQRPADRESAALFVVSASAVYLGEPDHRIGPAGTSRMTSASVELLQAVVP
jgi:hypothetical protein